MASTVAQVRASLIDNFLQDRLPRHFVLHHNSQCTLPGDDTVHTHRVLLINEIHNGRVTELMKKDTVTNRQVYIGEKFHEVSLSAAGVLSFHILVLFGLFECFAWLRRLRVETTQCVTCRHFTRRFLGSLSALDWSFQWEQMMFIASSDFHPIPSARFAMRLPLHVLLNNAAQMCLSLWV